MIEAFILSNSIELIAIGCILLVLSFIIPVDTYSFICRVASIAFIAIGLFSFGKSTEREEWQSKMLQIELELAKEQARSEQINTEIVTVYADKIKYIDRIENQEVSVFVTADGDKECKINNGFVSLHDSIVDKAIAIPSESDPAVSNYTLSDVAEVMKKNYSIAARNAEKLAQLQEWIRQQESLRNKAAE